MRKIIALLLSGAAVITVVLCARLSGNTADEYSNKTGAERFTFYIDKETGTLLKYVGLDSEGEISDYMISDRISFDNSFDMESDIETVTEKMVSYTAE